jgi:hypothetical protein
MVNACGSYLSFKDFSGGPFRMYEEVCERLKNLSSPILLTIGDIIHLRVLLYSSAALLVDKIGMG